MAIDPKEICNCDDAKALVVLLDQLCTGITLVFGTCPVCHGNVPRSGHEDGCPWVKARIHLADRRLAEKLLEKNQMAERLPYP